MPGRPELGVVLPWAARVWHVPVGPALTGVTDARALRDSDEHTRTTPRSGPAAAPLLAGLATPYRPQPPVCPGDVPPLDDEALTSAAVLLDVLASRSRHVATGPTILSEIVGVFRGVAALADPASAEVDAAALVDAAVGPAAPEREAGARALLERQRGPDGASPYAPESAAEALRRIEAMAALVVRDVRLGMEAQDADDHRLA